jgi:hypothetical protein
MNLNPPHRNSLPLVITRAYRSMKLIATPHPFHILLVRQHFQNPPGTQASHIEFIVNNAMHCANATIWSFVYFANCYPTIIEYIYAFYSFLFVRIFKCTPKIFYSVFANQGDGRNNAFVRDCKRACYDISHSMETC